MQYATDQIDTTPRDIHIPQGSRAALYPITNKSKKYDMLRGAPIRQIRQEVTLTYHKRNVWGHVQSLEIRGRHQKRTWVTVPDICSPSSGTTPYTTLKHNTDVKRAILPTTLTGSPGQDTLLSLSAVSPKAQQIKARVTMGRSRTLLITWGKYSVRWSANGAARAKRASGSQSGKGQHHVPSFLPSSGLYPNRSFAHDPKALHTGAQVPVGLLACPIGHITHAACFLTATPVCLGPASSLNGMTAEARNTRIGFLSTIISNRTSGPSLNTHHRAFAAH